MKDFLESKIFIIKIHSDERSAHLMCGQSDFQTSEWQSSDQLKFRHHKNFRLQVFKWLEYHIAGAIWLLNFQECDHHSIKAYHMELASAF